MGNRICVSIQLHTQKERYSHLVCLKMVTPGPDSSDGPSAHSPISRPHPWEATAAHEALELVPFPFTGQVSARGDTDRLGPSQVRIKAGGDSREAQPWVCCAGRLHPWKHLSPGTLPGALLPTFPEGTGAQPAIALSARQPKKGSLRGAHTPLLEANPCSTCFLYKHNCGQHAVFRQKALYLTKKRGGG